MPDDLGSMNDRKHWATDTWCQYLPALHRTLAAPQEEHGLPRNFARLDFEQTCAWWETLRYLFRSLLGWRCIPAGLAWWYEAGKPDLGDARLQLAKDRWDTQGELDFFAAREWDTGGFTGTGEDFSAWQVKDYEPHPDWREALRRRLPLEPGPWGGGYNPLHLGHSDLIGEAPSLIPPQGHHDIATRRAVLVVSRFDSWRQELRAYGATLPAVGEHSWHVEVFDREAGWIGLFRQSRITGRWFQGKHSLHMAGNP